MCTNSSFLNPNLTLLTGPCGHKICTSCVESVFAQDRASCPSCGQKVSRSQYFQAAFDDITVETEIPIRKRIMRRFHKSREEFTNLREYNDHLEWLEDLIFNLANNIDVEQTEAKIKEYQIQNAESIERSTARAAEEQRELHARIAAEEEEAAAARKAEEVEEAERQAAFEDAKKELMAALAAGSITTAEAQQASDELMAKVKAARKAKQQGLAPPPLDTSSITAFGRAQYTGSSNALPPSMMTHANPAPLASSTTAPPPHPDNSLPVPKQGEMERVAAEPMDIAPIDADSQEAIQAAYSAAAKAALSKSRAEAAAGYSASYVSTRAAAEAFSGLLLGV